MRRTPQYALPGENVVAGRRPWERIARRGLAALLLFALLTPLPALLAQDEDALPALDDNDEGGAPICAPAVAALPATASPMSVPEALTALEEGPANAFAELVLAEAVPSRAPPRA